MKMAKNSTMNLSEFIQILDGVKNKYGDLPVLGECDECQRTSLSVWVLTAANEMEAVIIQVSGYGTEE
jgi:hypothetical protein